MFTHAEAVLVGTQVTLGHGDRKSVEFVAKWFSRRWQGQPSSARSGRQTWLLDRSGGEGAGDLEVVDGGLQTEAEDGREVQWIGVDGQSFGQDAVRAEAFQRDSRMARCQLR
ncbi:hypothetical protein QRX50_35050 [Amycolatopsis carbonis]|uniref:Uncharacterized protein n=1 Tax=Amycolatopsis carbonis TaxID=715471 RepID=A0A9Y2MQ02_9PSEU|nr:hypothetical protein [Amycolatopsis sp. 2-15]WIX76645.1 hypothetical protein QRX50_35050 [Amycolatopsis sp. 2-15]